MSFEYHLYSKLLSSADNKSQQAFLGCKCSHSVCQLTLSHIAFYITSQEALLRQHDLLANSAGLGAGRNGVLEAVWWQQQTVLITVPEQPWRKAEPLETLCLLK